MKESKKGTSARPERKRKKLRVKELEKKVVPSPLANKKPPIPPPYAPGTYYGLARRGNIS